MASASNGNALSPQILMLATVSGAHSGRSGYSILADYVPGAQLIEAPRRRPKNRMEWLASAFLRQLTLTRWYLPGSARMEWDGWRALRARPGGVVHVLWADCDLGFFDLLCNAVDRPLCGTFHCDNETLAQIIAFPRRLHRLSSIILMSEAQRSFFEEHRVPRERVHVVHHGVDTDFFVPPNQPQHYPFNVLFVGSHRRNFDVLRDVCEALECIRDLKIWIVAPESFRSMFIDMSHVCFMTALSSAQLLNTYQRASCLLMTAQQATANNSVLEAMACGLPIVGERIGGIPEYVTPQCALLTEPGRAEALVEAVERLQQSADLHRQMALAARRRAEELDWRVAAGRMIQIYSDLDRDFS